MKFILAYLILGCIFVVVAQVVLRNNLKKPIGNENYIIFVCWPALLFIFACYMGKVVWYKKKLQNAIVKDAKLKLKAIKLQIRLNRVLLDMPVAQAELEKTAKEFKAWCKAKNIGNIKGR